MANKRYRVLEAEDSSELESKVEEAINLGWTLQGGVSVVESSADAGQGMRSIHYCQAITSDG